jgi:hypothetical protein
MNEKVAKRIATIISWGFNPMIMPSIGLLLIFGSHSYLSLIPFEGKRIIFFIVFAGTFLVPLSFIPVFYYLKLISTVEMNRVERIAPLFATAIVYFFTFYLIRRIPFHFINAFLLASAIAVLANAIINSWWKISSHMIGIGGIIGLIIGLFVRYNINISLSLPCAILAAGLIGYSRLELESHTPSQIYGGFFLGCALVAGILILL